MPLVLLVVLLLLAGCEAPGGAAVRVPDGDASRVAEGPVRTGAQVLADDGFRRLRGLRVGLIVNHTARVGDAHLIDLVAAAEDVEVAALFGPEHGLRGTADAGEKIDDGRDDRTGAPVYSLYGSTNKPTPAMLDGVDALVFDIQDIGARFYTYISTMGLAMQAAAEAGIPFIVLDRPNPLGGAYASGFVLDPAHASFVGLYPIPVAHGMTVGELARMIRAEGWLPGLDGLDLDVVAADGWRRSMRWPETGLPWIRPSPNIPDYETALVYPGAAFFEAAAASEGRGTETPFLLLGAPWADAQALADTLNARRLAGVRFEPSQFTPRSIDGMASSPKLEGAALSGVRYVVTEDSVFRPVEAGIHVLHAFYGQARAGGHELISRPEWLTKLGGTPRLGRMLRDGARPEAIIAAWQGEVAAFDRRRALYLLYD
ncbi:MAG: DUF1343 domain-containing protein [Rhodothermales bacterium]|nr:DUF1343 domain-containing protein [Rhodothermales bacterium]